MLTRTHCDRQPNEIIIKSWIGPGWGRGARGLAVVSLRMSWLMLVPLPDNDGDGRRPEKSTTLVVVEAAEGRQTSYSKYLCRKTILYMYTRENIIQFSGLLCVSSSSSSSWFARCVAWLSSPVARFPSRPFVVFPAVAGLFNIRG